MARTRNLKPSFFTNDLLAEISPLGRLLFQGLWCHADREGRLHDRPRKIKAEILPYDDCDVDSLLNQLQKLGFIRRYGTEDARFIQVVNFGKHQNPHIKEQASEIPAPDLHQTSTVQVPDEPRKGDDEPGLLLTTLTLNPSSLTYPQESASPAAPLKLKTKKADYSEIFENAYSAYPRKGDTNKQSAFKAWSARLKAGSTEEEMLAGVIRYGDYCRVMGTENQFIKQPSSFFGPDKHFLLDWTPVAQAQKRQFQSEADLNRAAIGNSLFPQRQERDITGECRHVAAIVG